MGNRGREVGGRGGRRFERDRSGNGQCLKRRGCFFGGGRCCLGGLVRQNGGGGSLGVGRLGEDKKYLGAGEGRRGAALHDFGKRR